MKLENFIVFEGGEGCGKSTQLKILSNKLEKLGREFILTREPGGTELGEKLRDLLLNTDFQNTVSFESEALMMAASRNQLCNEVILPALSKKQIVLCDRFVGSSYVYQGVVRDLGLDRVSQINNWVEKNCLPKATILLDGSYEDFSNRLSKRNFDRIESEGESFHKKIYSTYTEIAKELNWYIVDATRSIGIVEEEIWSIVESNIANT